MKRFVEGLDRGQGTIFPETLDDFVAEDNGVRVVEAFVESLDLGALGFSGVDPKATGRPSYHPSVLLKLYIYGYLNRVQSSRRLEREAGRNVEVMWLTGRLVPDHKTIADFRKDHGSAIGKVCAQFVTLCRRLGLLAEASVAIDGSKFKAVNNRDRNFTAAKMRRRMAQIEESVARYLHQLDSADRQEPSLAQTMKTTRLKEKIERLKEEMGRLEALDAERRKRPDQQISLTDPDARSMATSPLGSPPGVRSLLYTPTPLSRGHGTPAEAGKSGGRLSRDGSGQGRPSDLSGRPGPGPLPRPGGPGGGPAGLALLALLRLLPDGEPRSPAVRDPGGQSGGRDAAPERGICPGFQPPARPGRAPAPTLCVYLLRQAANLPLKQVAGRFAISRLWISRLQGRIERGEPDRGLRPLPRRFDLPIDPTPPQGPDFDLLRRV
jgi:transposase